jgi:hypothetical protein
LGVVGPPRLGGVPEIVVDDPQMRRLGVDPLTLRIDAVTRPAGVGIWDVATPVPDHLTDVEVIVEHADWID